MRVSVISIRLSTLIPAMLSIAIGTVSFSLRLWHLDDPPRMYFDEVAHAGGAEAILCGQRARVWGMHPPLSHSLMALSIASFNCVTSTPIDLPFVPTSVAYHPGSNTLYGLSPDGSSLIAMSCMAPFRLRQIHLRFPCRSVHRAAHPSTVFVIDRNQPVMRQLDELGNELREVRLPFLPDRIFSVEDNPHFVLAVNLSRGRVIGLDLYAHQVVWKKEFHHPLSDAAADTVYGMCFLTIPHSQNVVALDFQGKVQRHWHVPFIPQSVISVLTPSVIPHERKTMRSSICVLGSSGREIAVIRPAGRIRLKTLRFSQPVRSIAGHVRAAYLYLLSSGKVTVLNPHTMEITRTLPTSSGAQVLLLTADSRWLISLSSTHRQLVVYHLPNPVWAARLPAAILGGFFMPLLGFWFAYRATRLLPLAIIFTLLIACDPLLWVLSRMAMIDIYVTGFVMAAYFFGYEHLQAETKRARTLLGISTGVFLGLAYASKWNAVPLITGLATLFWLARGQQTTNAQTNTRHLSSPFLLFFLAGLPMLVYFACYVLAYAHGTSLIQVIQLQIRMLRFHVTFSNPHPLDSSWWLWPLGMKTDLLFHNDEGGYGKWIYLCGAPWLWLPGLFCVGVTVVRAWRTRESFPTLIVVAFAFAWLPWMLSPRSSFLYYFSTGLPFLYMVVAYVIGNVRSGAWQVSARWREHILLLCDGYIVLAVLTFVWLYPTLTGYPLPSQAGHHYSAWWMGWLPILAPQ